MSLTIESTIKKAKCRVGLPSPAVCRLIREQSQLTQQHFAEALCTDRSTVSRWESGERAPRGDMRDCYASLLDRLKREVLS